MKKRILSLVIAVAIVLSFVVFVPSIGKTPAIMINEKEELVVNKQKVRLRARKNKVFSDKAMMNNKKFHRKMS